MNKMLNEIMSQFDCTEAEAVTILDNILNKSNIARKAILNASKKEYEVE